MYKTKFKKLLINFCGAQGCNGVNLRLLLIFIFFNHNQENIRFAENKDVNI